MMRHAHTHTHTQARTRTNMYPQLAPNTRVCMHKINAQFAFKWNNHQLNGVL